jgi:hypothetical protein
MTNPHAWVTIDDEAPSGEAGASDVLAESEIVHVTPAAAELAESIAHGGEIGFITDVADWDEPPDR